MNAKRLYNGSMLFLLGVLAIYFWLVLPVTFSNRYIIQLTDGSKIEASYHGREEGNVYYYPYKSGGFDWDRGKVSIEKVVEIIVLKESYDLLAPVHVKGISYTYAIQ